MPCSTEDYLNNLYREKLEATLKSFESIGLEPTHFHLQAIARKVADDAVKQARG